jgi:hypothetical protein
VTPFLSSLIGDGAGNVAVSTQAVFLIRTGSVHGIVIDGESVPESPTPPPTSIETTLPTPTATPTDTPTPTPTSTTTLAPGATPTPTPTATPTAGPTPTPQPYVLSFYGTSTSPDASGGGPPGSVNENQMIGIDSMAVTFHNTSTGPNPGGCSWNFGDGDTSNSCGNTVDHTYTDRGLYTVTLNIDGHVLTRTSYVLVGCKVPAFAGVHKNSATTNWTNAGFASGNISFLSGNGNYKIGYQSLTGGMVNPVGGCSGATITVGP